MSSDLVPEGANARAEFTVTLSEPSATTVKVRYATRDVTVTATARLDYAKKSGTLRIPAGKTSGIVKVSVKNDRLVEGDETFELVVTKPPAGWSVAAPGEATIVDND